MSFPLIPDTAPFSSEQRAWLNGFFAGLLNVGQTPSLPVGQASSLPVAELRKR